MKKDLGTPGPSGLHPKPKSKDSHSAQPSGLLHGQIIIEKLPKNPVNASEAEVYPNIEKIIERWQNKRQLRSLPNYKMI